MKRGTSFFWMFVVCTLSLCLSGCSGEELIPIPSWGNNSLLPGKQPLNSTTKSLMEGIYHVTATTGNFKDTIVVKWNRSFLSLACRNGNYFVIEGGIKDSTISLEGYWRDALGDATGLCTLTIDKSEGGSDLARGSMPEKLVMRGTFGNGEVQPDQPLTLTFLRTFSDKVRKSQFHVLAHRGGGRTSDRLPVSENSIEMLNWTERLGSTGVELDVRLSRDKIPFLYHDPDLNIRLTMKGPLAGDVRAYSWQELSTHVRLIHGEKIPSLEAALTFLIDSTKLDFVYLDMKENNEAMSVVIPIQQKMLKRASEKSRTVTIVVGIPTNAVRNDFMNYPGYKEIPSLCELSAEDTGNLNSLVWAPRWTLGTQNELVRQMHNEGRMAICWTIDNPAWIREFIANGQFDGLLSNYPSIVTYFHSIQN